MSDASEFEVPLPRLAAWLKRRQFVTADKLPKGELLSMALVRFITDPENLDGLGLPQSAEQARILVRVQQVCKETAVWELVAALPAPVEAEPLPAPVPVVPAGDGFPDDLPLPQGLTREEALLLWAAYLEGGKSEGLQMKLSGQVFPGRENRLKRDASDLWLRFAIQGIPYKAGDAIPERFKERPAPRPQAARPPVQDHRRPQHHHDHRCDHHRHEDRGAEQGAVPQPPVKPGFLGNPEVTLTALIMAGILLIISLVEFWLLLRR